MNLQKQIEALKEQRIQEILDDNTLSKIDKLKLFETEQLFICAPYIQNEFPEWVAEAKTLAKAEIKDRSTIEYYSIMTDSIFDPSNDKYEKYETVSYAEELEDLNSEESDLIVVITTRGPAISLIKTRQEVIDVVFDFCVKNRFWGFKNDW